MFILVIQGRDLKNYKTLQDKELMKLYLHDDNLAFNEIYSRYQSNVYSYLKKRLKDDNLIHDIFQNCFIKFHKSRQNYNSKYPLIKWIYTITRSVMLDELKKRKINKTEYIDNINYKPEEYISQQVSIEIDTESSLTSKEKEALKLKYFSENDYNEISIVLNSSQSNARKLVSRALQKLRLKYVGGQK